MHAYIYIYILSLTNMYACFGALEIFHRYPVYICTLLQHTTTYCNTLQYTTSHSLFLVCFSFPHPPRLLVNLYIAATHYNIMQLNAIHYPIFALPRLLLSPLSPRLPVCLYVATSRHNILQHSNTLQRSPSSAFLFLPLRDYLCACTLLQHTTTYCNTAMHYITFALCFSLFPPANTSVSVHRCNTPQDTAKHSNILHHISFSSCAPLSPPPCLRIVPLSHSRTYSRAFLFNLSLPATRVDTRAPYIFPKYAFIFLQKSPTSPQKKPIFRTLSRCLPPL